MKERLWLASHTLVPCGGREHGCEVRTVVWRRIPARGANRIRRDGVLPMVMQGFPPPPDQRWRLEDWQTAAANTWSFTHLREVVPTARVTRGTGPVRELQQGPAASLDIGLERTDGSSASVREVLSGTYTDGYLVLSGGRIAAEEYYAGMAPQHPHLLMSVSKSIIGCVVGILVDRGTLDPAQSITRYVPELRSSGYADASVRDLLDMRSGVVFSETYLDPDADVRLLEQVMGWAPRRQDDLPTSIYDYVVRLKADRPHGGRFDYRSCETDVLGWVCERATGRRMPDLLGGLLWSRLGPEHDADAAVDPAGAVLHDGGLAATLRDLGRFGQLLADNGRIAHEEIVPEWWLDDAYVGGSDSRAAFAADPTTGWLPGGMYRNQFWVPYTDRHVLLCLGIHGQLVWVDRDRRVVVAKLSHWPYPQDLGMLLDTLRAIEALTEALA
jgi:CubicO group peptidase (beta-lactamase class C family)